MGCHRCAAAAGGAVKAGICLAQSVSSANNLSMAPSIARRGAGWARETAWIAGDGVEEGGEGTPSAAILKSLPVVSACHSVLAAVEVIVLFVRKFSR